MPELKDITTALKTKTAELQTAAKSMKMEVNGNDVHLDPTEFKNITKLQDEVKELRRLVDVHQEVKEVNELLEAPEDRGPADAGVSAPQFKSMADHLLDSPEFKEMVERNQTSMQWIEVNQPDITAGYKDVYSDMFSVNRTRAIGTRVQELPTLDKSKHQPNRVRDLFPVASTNANLLEYFISKGLAAANPPVAGRADKRGNATTVGERVGSEFAPKPKSTIEFDAAQDPVRTIAHWIPAHRNVLADQPMLRSLINNELMYGLAIEEDWQLLNGDGVGNNIRGLLQRTGIGTYTPAVAQPMTDSLRKAQTVATLALYPATGYVMHPLDWELVELQKAQGDGHYMVATNVVVGAQSRVWRLPVVESTAIAQGTFLTAAFGQACQVYDRERANIRVAEQHADFFVRNAIVVLAEERLGLTVQVPEAVIKGSFTPAP